jgi:hypothetical protein
VSNLSYCVFILALIIHQNQKLRLKRRQVLDYEFPTLYRIAMKFVASWSSGYFILKYIIRCREIISQFIHSILLSWLCAFFILYRKCQNQLTYKDRMSSRSSCERDNAWKHHIHQRVVCYRSLFCLNLYIFRMYICVLLHMCVKRAVRL